MYAMYVCMLNAGKFILIDFFVENGYPTHQKDIVIVYIYKKYFTTPFLLVQQMESSYC